MRSLWFEWSAFVELMNLLWGLVLPLLRASPRKSRKHAQRFCSYVSLMLCWWRWLYFQYSLTTLLSSIRYLYLVLFYLLLHQGPQDPPCLLLFLSYLSHPVIHDHPVTCGSTSSAGYIFVIFRLIDWNLFKSPWNQESLLLEVL